MRWEGGQRFLRMREALGHQFVRRGRSGPLGCVFRPAYRSYAPTPDNRCGPRRRTPPLSHRRIGRIRSRILLPLPDACRQPRHRLRATHTPAAGRVFLATPSRRARARRRSGRRETLRLLAAAEITGPKADVASNHWYPRHAPWPRGGRRAIREGGAPRRRKRSSTHNWCNLRGRIGDPRTRQDPWGKEGPKGVPPGRLWPRNSPWLCISGKPGVPPSCCSGGRPTWRARRCPPQSLLSCERVTGVA
jgi:hypothetical protein